MDSRNIQCVALIRADLFSLARAENIKIYENDFSHVESD